MSGRMSRPKETPPSGAAAPSPSPGLASAPNPGSKAPQPAPHAASAERRRGIAREGPRVVIGSPQREREGDVGDGVPRVDVADPHGARGVLDARLGRRQKA